MGITIDVQSLYDYIAHTKWQPDMKEVVWQAYSQEICVAFSWTTLPWQDRTHHRGLTEFSANYSKYALVRAIAEGSFHGEADFSSHKEVRQTRFERFRHFLDTDEYKSFYLPVNFHPPKHLVNGITSDSFMAGSSFRLAEEMRLLRLELRGFMRQYGEDVRVNDTNSHTWRNLDEFCTGVEQACKESKELQLPVLLCY